VVADPSESLAGASPPRGSGAKHVVPVRRGVLGSYVECRGGFHATLDVRLGVTSAIIGWLSSIPSLIAVFPLIPAVRFLESKSRRALWLRGSLFIWRLGYLLATLWPWFLDGGQALALVWLLIGPSSLLTSFSAGFSPLLADVVSERDRARVFSNRSIVLEGWTRRSNRATLVRCGDPWQTSPYRRSV
jgi:hypothetical protein